MAHELLDTRKEEKREDKAARKRRRELSDIRTVLKTPEGRRFYWRVMAHAGVFIRSYTGEVNSTMFNEGKREVGNWLFNELFDANPNIYTQMSQENDSEVESEKRIEEMEHKQSDSLT